jgi:hypothetical protein
MPARLRDIRRAFEKYGGTIVEPTSGSHFKAVRGSITFPLPGGNGLRTELSDKYIHLLCRAFGIDVTEFKRLL